MANAERFTAEPFGEWGAVTRILWMAVESASHEDEAQLWMGALVTAGSEYEQRSERQDDG